MDKTEGNIQMMGMLIVQQMIDMKMPMETIQEFIHGYNKNISVSTIDQIIVNNTQTECIDLISESSDEEEIVVKKLINKLKKTGYNKKKSVSLKRNERKCLDCKKDISKNAKRCNNCNNKYIFTQRKNTKRPTYKQLQSDMKSMPMTKIGIKYGVSDNAVRK